MDLYDRLRYGREPAPSSIAKMSRGDYGDYGREHELDPYGAPHIEGRDLVSAGRERELEPYRPRRPEERDLLSSGREYGLDSYRTARMEGADLLYSSREREREHELDPYRSCTEGRDLLSSSRGYGLDLHKPPRLEERDLLSLGRAREHDPYGPPYIEGRYENPEIRGSWRERDPLVGVKDSSKARTINGTGGVPSTDVGRLGLGMGSSRVRSASRDDPIVMGSGPRFDGGLSGRQEPLGHNEFNRDFEATRGGADSASGPILFVEGLPADCTRREAAHVFRPFIGFKEVRVVHKEPKRSGGEKLVLCFVEFADARYASTALEALQGYKFDERDTQSANLRLSFARYSGSKGAAYRDEPRGGRDLERDYYRPQSLRW